MLIDVSPFPVVPEFYDFRKLLQASVGVAHQFPPMVRKFHLILWCQLLVRENQYLMLAKQVIKCFKCFAGDHPDINASHSGTHRCGELFHFHDTLCSVPVNADSLHSFELDNAIDCGVSTQQKHPLVVPRRLRHPH